MYNKNKIYDNFYFFETKRCLKNSRDWKRFKKWTFSLFLIASNLILQYGDDLANMRHLSEFFKINFDQKIKYDDIRKFFNFLIYKIYLKPKFYKFNRIKLWFSVKIYTNDGSMSDCINLSNESVEPEWRVSGVSVIGLTLWVIAGQN